MVTKHASIRLGYPLHMPFFVHRELYREALEDQWHQERRLASAERFRGPFAIETRLLLPAYQRYRRPRAMSFEVAFQRLFDLNGDHALDAVELLGLSQFLNCSVATLGHWLQFPTVPQSSSSGSTLETEFSEAEGVTMKTLQQSSGLMSAFSISAKRWQQYMARVDKGHIISDFVAVRRGNSAAALAAILRKKPQLVCVNDGMDSMD